MNVPSKFKKKNRKLQQIENLKEIEAIKNEVKMLELQNTITKMQRSVTQQQNEEDRGKNQ